MMIGKVVGSGSKGDLMASTPRDNDASHQSSDTDSGQAGTRKMAMQHPVDDMQSIQSGVAAAVASKLAQ